MICNIKRRHVPELVYAEVLDESLLPMKFNFQSYLHDRRIYTMRKNIIPLKPENVFTGQDHVVTATVFVGGGLGTFDNKYI